MGDSAGALPTETASCPLPPPPQLMGRNRTTESPQTRTLTATSPSAGAESLPWESGLASRSALPPGSAGGGLTRTGSQGRAGLELRPADA